MSAIDHPYRDFLHRVKKPAQYVGGEQGEVHKDWQAVDCRMCLAFPDLYEIGMSHLGYKILYGILNAHPRLLAERAYAPWSDMEKELREQGEWIRSLESARPLKDFDVVGFSLQFELTYSNVLLMLDLGGISRWSETRGEDEPLVLAGGPTATHAEPLAPFVDAFLIGDGEERTPEILLTWGKLKQAGIARLDRLKALAALGGVYVPRLYETGLDAETGLEVVMRSRSEHAPLPVQRAFIERLDDYPFPTDGPVASTETVFDRVSVEIARGCTEGCRFCQAGMIYRPVRERSPEAIIDAVSQAVRGGGYDEASLTCLSTADYSAISPLVREVMSKLEGDRVSLSVSSLRAYGLDENVLDEMKKSRATGLTFAPEAGTQRMRDVINKNISEEQLMQTAERVFSRGWSKMKLYFMIGLPTEEDEDVMGIVATGARALGVGYRLMGRGRAKVTVSVSIHVPKPHTPFQWCAMDEREEVRRKQQLLRDEARKSRVQLKMHDSAGSWLEGVLSRGDRALAPVIASAYDLGARFDSWDEVFKLEAWEQAFAQHGIDVRKYLGTFPTSARLPWDHIDVGLEPGFLVREYRKALGSRLSPPCGKVAGAYVHATHIKQAEAESRRLVCYDCGIACDLGQMREERLVFLRSLNAYDAPAPSVAEPRSKERRPMLHVEQGPTQRLRLGFTKLGRAIYQGHLDMVRLLPRIFRRAGLPLYYTQGFHPKPAMTFAPALSLGTASLCEYVDLRLCGAEPIALEGLVDALNAASPEGFRFFAALHLGADDAALSRIVDEVDYVIALPHQVLRDQGYPSLESLQARLAEARSGEMSIRREVQGIGKVVKVDEFLSDAQLRESSETFAQAGFHGAFYALDLRLRWTQQGSARPAEALEALLGLRGAAFPAVRSDMVAVRAERRIRPLDLDALRKTAERKRSEVSAEASAS